MFIIFYAFEIYIFKFIQFEIYYFYYIQNCCLTNGIQEYYLHLIQNENFGYSIQHIFYNHILK